MMRSVLLLIIMVVSLHPAIAPGSMTEPEATQAFAQANQMYEADDFAGALQAYESILATPLANAQVYANAGNAAHMTGDNGRAVLYYTRALRLDPANDIARQNLTRIQPRTNAEGEDDLFRVMQELLRGIPGWTWILAAELAFVGALIVLCVAGWRARTLADTADWFLRAAGLVVIAAVLTGLGAIATLSTSGKGDAVVMQDNVVTRMGPGERYLEHLSLPAGTLVELPEAPSDGWVRCRLLDGRTGYIRTETLERL